MNSTWKNVGICAMDTAGLLIADPCYVMNQNGRDPKTLELNDYSKWVKSKEEVTKLNFNRGREGAGIIFHSPHGDGCVDVWAKMDGEGRVRSVFFSFDGEIPKN
jgi:hypothetical protein